jgi:hypothetical protein
LTQLDLAACDVTHQVTIASAAAAAAADVSVVCSYDDIVVEAMLVVK